MRKEIGANGENSADMQRAVELVFAGHGDVFDGGGFLENPLRLFDHLLANRCCPHVVFRALKKLNAQLTLKFFNRYTKRRLIDVAALRGLAKMLHLGKSDDVAEFGKGHKFDL